MIFKGLIREIIFENTSLYPVTVTLWHPDNGEEFMFCDVKGGTSVKLCNHDRKPIGVGDDWGVQLGYSEIKEIKRDSMIKPISQFPKYDKDPRVFQISVDLFRGAGNGVRSQALNP